MANLRAKVDWEEDVSIPDIFDNPELIAEGQWFGPSECPMRCSSQMPVWIEFEAWFAAKRRFRLGGRMWSADKQAVSRGR